MPNRYQPAEFDEVSAVPNPALAALLDSVDGAERELHIEQPSERGATGDVFAQVLGDLSANLDPEIAVLPAQFRRRPPVPRPLGAPGDLVVVIGAGADALSVVRSMATASAAVEIAVAGSIELIGTVRVDDRRTAVRARAMGVQNAGPVFVALGLEPGPTAGAQWADIIGGIAPDQVWVAVDAGRKPEDTASWVNTVAALTPVDAVAVVGSTLTSTPDTVNELNLPIGWVDGVAASSPRPNPPVWDSGADASSYA